MLNVVTACVDKFHNGQYAMLPLESGQSLLFLFSPYTPYNYPDDRAIVDAYYVQSNIGYQSAKQLISLLNQNGVGAAFYQSNDVKVLAQRCGGAFGKNNLLFLEGYGSYFFISAILLDGIYKKYLPQTVLPCDNCGICVKACPTDALQNGFCRERCLRHWHDLPNDMPDGIAAKNGRRLIGCDTCQAVCPLNSVQRTKPPQKLQDLLKIDDLQKVLCDKISLTELGSFIGSNYATKKRICGMAEIINKGKNLC